MVFGRLFFSKTLCTRKCLHYCTVPQLKTRMAKLSLSQVVSELMKFAPKHLAGDWDNVGLLVEPSSPHEVTKILVTNDLTEPVLEEALASGANMIYSYHPPLFEKLQRINCSTWKQRIAVRCLENRIAIYSPHTTLDVLPDGLNDWLIGAFDVCDVKPIEQSYANKTASGCSHTIRINVSEGKVSVEELEKELQSLEISLHYNENTSEFVVHCDDRQLVKISSFLSVHNLLKASHVTKEELLPIPDAGYGRIGKLREKITLKEAVQLVKDHLGLEHVRLGVALGSTNDTFINSVGVCAGAGDSFVPTAIQECDLYVTGELRHHVTLNAVSSGLNVILCEHSNSERGFLKALAPRLEKLFKNKIEVIVSAVDKDPLVCA